MEAIVTLLDLVESVVMLVSFVSLLWPLKRLGLPTCKRSALVLLLSFDERVATAMDAAIQFSTTTAGLQTSARC